MKRRFQTRIPTHPTTTDCKNVEEIMKQQKIRAIPLLLLDSKGKVKEKCP
jgi:hypothetical protein